MQKDALADYSYGELIDLAKLFSRYIISKASCYADYMLPRLGLSAFFDTHVLKASVPAIENVYRVSRELEEDETLIAKLQSLDTEGLMDLLVEYDNYIIDFEPIRISCDLPVGLTEFCVCDLPEYAYHLMCDRLDAQHAAYKSKLMAEGTQAMLEKNFALLSLVECFMNGYRRADIHDVRYAATLVRDNVFIPAILEWANGKNIPIMPEPERFDALFAQFKTHVTHLAEYRRILHESKQ